MTTGTDPYQLRLAIDQAERDGTLRRAVALKLRTRSTRWVLVGRRGQGQASGQGCVRRVSCCGLRALSARCSM